MAPVMASLIFHRVLLINLMSHCLRCTKRQIGNKCTVYVFLSKTFDRTWKNGCMDGGMKEGSKEWREG